MRWLERFFFPCLHMAQPILILVRRRTQEMRHWHESEEYQWEMTQGQLDFDEKNMSPEPGKSEWELIAPPDRKVGNLEVLGKTLYIYIYICIDIIYIYIAFWKYLPTSICLGVAMNERLSRNCGSACRPAASVLRARLRSPAWFVAKRGDEPTSATARPGDEGQRTNHQETYLKIYLIKIKDSFVRKLPRYGWMSMVSLHVRMLIIEEATAVGKWKQ